jgi:O-antigen/teichoic acid export membrane protein
MLQTEQKSAIQIDVSGRMLARNTMLNLAGQVLPLLVAIFTVPYVIHQLGPDRYGLYSLAWTVVGYFALFDLGIGPATTKYVAELLGSGETDRLPEMVWTAVASQTCLGLIAGILVAAASPFLVEHVLKIPAGLHPQAQVIFLIMAVALPVDFASGSVQGVLGASQRFDLLNAIRVPSGLLTYLVPVAILALGFGLPTIVFSLVLVRVVTSAIMLALAIRLYPTLRSIRLDFGLVRSLLGFGGWVTISAAVSPILAYFDRFLIGMIVSIAGVGFYTPPYLISSKLCMLAGSLALALFPAFSTSAGRADSDWIRRALIRSLKFIILTVGPTAVALAFFARPVLALWLGPRFASEGTLVLQILVLAMFANSLAQVPFALLYGLGRPDLPAKFHLIELPICIGLDWFLIKKYALVGAAVAWVVNNGLDLLLLTAWACRMTRTSPRTFANKDLVRSIGSLAVLTMGFALVWASTHVLIADVFFALLLSGVFLLVSWRYILNLEEKWQIRVWLKIAQ